jgi:hypothetical protein
MFDVFYNGPKPNRFVFEQPADSLEDAAEKSRTRFYWYIYGSNDYTNFDLVGDQFLGKNIKHIVLVHSGNAQVVHT